MNCIRLPHLRPHPLPHPEGMVMAGPNGGYDPSDEDCPEDSRFTPYAPYDPADEDEPDDSRFRS